MQQIITFGANPAKMQAESISYAQVTRFLIAANVKRELYMKVKETSITLTNFARNLKSRLLSRQRKKEFLAQAFDREFQTLEEYYKQKSKKNKKLKTTLKLFTTINKKMQDTDEADVDNNA